MEFETIFVLSWLGSGLLGSAIIFIKNTEEMKEKCIIILMIGITAGIGCGPLTLITAFKPDALE